MFVIKDENSKEFAKYIGVPANNDYYQYVDYPWETVENMEDAQEYTTLEHANEIAFWRLDHTRKWIIVDTESGQEYQKKTGKYLPV